MQNIDQQHQQPPAATEVQLDVHYAGVNRADLMQRAGHYPPPAGVTEILGLEVSGVVRACGAEVSHVQVGDKVCALLAGGGYARSVTVSAGQVQRIPSGIELVAAAALPEAFATAWFNLIDLAQLQPQERVLLHAGASGVGVAAIQIARWRQADVFVTVGSQAKLDFCQQLGADAGWVRGHGDFTEVVTEWGGADVILDPVGADYIAANQAVLKQDGRWILIGLLSGRYGQLDCGRLLMKCQRIQGSTLRNQTTAVKSHLMHALATHIWPQLSNGAIKMPVDRMFSMQDVDAAHQYLQDNQNAGKVVLAMQE